MMKIEGFGSGSESGSISQRHGSADPDPHQNGQHCQKVVEKFAYLVVQRIDLGMGEKVSGNKNNKNC
jgi:hypothetical protein